MNKDEAIKKKKKKKNESEQRVSCTCGGCC